MRIFIFILFIFTSSAYSNHNEWERSFQKNVNEIILIDTLIINNQDCFCNDPDNEILKYNFCKKENYLQIINSVETIICYIDNNRPKSVLLDFYTDIPPPAIA